ncbi:MAG: hypothetical protein HOV79_09250 [Hamadaea sp.]|nr:hypothetical protein [Hamadaea sp.]
MTDSSLWRFRDLVLDVRDTAQPGFGGEVLLPWLERHPEVVAELRDVGRPESHARVVGRDECLLEGLYAVSRLVDILVAPHQPVNGDPAVLSWLSPGHPWWVGPLPSVAAWSSFCGAIGAIAIAEDSFHPFFHEIVAVTPAEDPAQPPTLIDQLWPGALIGGLVLARAGVTVRAGADHLDPDVAARSCLYWAWWRRNRVARDLSHGWGHNSQWRTDFRRDYLVGDALHYNVDCAVPTLPNPADEDTDLTPQDRRDLVRYRHSVTIDLGDDRWPYYDSLVEPRARPTVI